MAERSMEAAPVDKPRVRWRFVYLAPILVFFILAVLFGSGLTRNPGEIPSVLIDKPVPEFALPPVQGRTLGLATSDLKQEVSLVNVFASWCIPCRVEHPLLRGLSERSNVPIHGLNYKDKPEEAEQWLAELGDPYARTGADLDGRVGIEWGVYGVPETFVVRANGRIAYKHIGQLTPMVINQTILPLVQELRDQARSEP